MNLRRSAPLWLALVSGAIFAGDGLRASSHNLTVSHEGELRECGDLDIHFGDSRHPMKTARAETTLTATTGEMPMIRASLPESGGITVRGGEGSGYRITVCKAAGARDASAAADLLDKISAKVSEGRIIVDGPSDRDWVAYVLVEAPEKTGVDLEARNGGVTLYDLGGKIRIKTQNGPVSLHRCAGDIKVDAENGPIDFSGGGGHVALRAENGPISVALAGAWEGEGLDVRTENGPLGLKLPPTLSSGIRIEASEHAPLSCKAEACADARKTWNDEHRLLELGGSPTLVRLSTVNGPVSVQSRSFEFE